MNSLLLVPPRTAAAPQTHFPLTPSPTSPFRAHRVPGDVKTTTTRPKPYHRTSIHHGVPSPFSPFTPTSASSSSGESVLSRSRSAVYSISASTTPAISLTDLTLSSSSSVSLQTPSSEQFDWVSQLPIHTQVQATQQQQQHLTVARTLQRADSAPALLLPHQPQQQHQPSQQQLPSPQPVVFTAEYIEAQLAKCGGPINPWAPPPQSQAKESFEYQVSADILSYLDAAGVVGSGAGLPPFPYASAYVPAVSSKLAVPSHRSSGGVTIDEKKQAYATELIEATIKTLHKIWPETSDEPSTSSPEVSPFAPSPTLSPGPDSFACQQQPTIGRLRKGQQQFTPDSSPDASKGGPTSDAAGRKRKVEEQQEHHQQHAQKKRCCVDEWDASARVAVPSSTPHHHHHTASSKNTSSANHITIRVFVRELLRRSKTSCNTLEVALCYLDGIEDTVRRLRDCLRLGIGFGTVAMAERGPYDEGMKDEGRIIKLEEFLKMQAQQLVDEASDDVRGDWNAPPASTTSEWMPISPASDSEGGANNNVKAKIQTNSTTPRPTSTVLATHPLLDARRTFLASLVLATKFIQDKAYSNKAWAKLSGLAGKEVGRCERALGGALGWRLWVGKDFDANASSIRSKSPVTAAEAESSCSGDSESAAVHGENDPLAKALIAAAMNKTVDVDALTPPPLATEQHQGAPAAAASAAARASSAGCSGSGRAKTWPLAMVAGETSSSVLAERMAAVHIQQNAQLALASAQASWPQAPPTTSSTSILAAPIVYASPEPSSVLSGSACPTVITTPATVKMFDGGEEHQGVEAPMMSMDAGGQQDYFCAASEEALLQSWLAAPTFPFTFTVQPRPAPPRRLLQVQRSTSPNSSSTFSSPEVLTPVHSRASTLVDVMEWVGGGSGGVLPEKKHLQQQQQHQQVYDFATQQLHGLTSAQVIL